jgi:hypothetical protein
MSDEQKELPPLWGLMALSWIVSFYFLISFQFNVGFPPERKLLLADAVYVFLWLFFLFLPFFSKVKIGKFLELERDIKKTKTELDKFKAEVDTRIALITSFNASHQVNVNFPSDLTTIQNPKQEFETQSEPIDLKASTESQKSSAI